jgi:GDP-L-fucose synthase
MISYRSMVTREDFTHETRAYFSGRRVAVPGGAGFIGSHVVEQLIALGAHPIVLTRRQWPGHLAHTLPQIEVQLCDLSDFSCVRGCFSGASVVLHLAAMVGGLQMNLAQPATIFQDNLQTFFNSIRAAREAGIERFLVTSSACVYPRHCSIPTPETEGFRDEPEPTNAGYGWAKRMQEFLGSKYAEEFGLEVAIARPYNAYGPRDNFNANSSHVIPALIRKAFGTEDGALPVWGDGSHSRSFLYVDDFARGLLEVAARLPTADPVNLGADEEVTIREVADRIAAEVGRVRGIRIAPQFDPAGLTGQPRRRCDTRKAERLLGYRARVPIAEGLRRTIQWFASVHEDRLMPTDI